MKKILALCAFAFVFVACNPQQTALNDLEKFTEHLEQKSSNWTPAEWDDAAQQYNEIIGTLDRYQYTDAELNKIGRLEARCSICFFKYYSSQAKETLHDVLQEGSGFLEELIKGLEE